MEVILEQSELSVDTVAKPTPLPTTNVTTDDLNQQNEFTILIVENEGVDGGEPPPAPPPTLASNELMSGLPVPPKIYQILPESFTFDIPPEQAVPSLKGVPLPDIYPLMCTLLGAPGYDLNLATFWFLDILAEALLVAQTLKQMSEKNQKTMIAWFGRVFKSMQENVWSREELFANLRSTVMAAGEEMFYWNWELLRPDQIVHHAEELQDVDVDGLTDPTTSPSKILRTGHSKHPSKVLSRVSSRERSKSHSKTPSKRGSRAPSRVPSKVSSRVPSRVPSKVPSKDGSHVFAEGDGVTDEDQAATDLEMLPDVELPDLSLLCEVATNDMITIMELLYGGFARAFTHGLVYNSFCNPGPLIECILPNELNLPKQLKPPPPPPPKPPKEKKGKKGKGKDKKEKKGKGKDKSEKSGKKGDKSEKSGKKDKKDKSEKGGKKDKSEKGGKKDKSEKGGKKGKSDKGSKKGGKKDKIQIIDIPEVIEPLPEKPPNPLLKYLPPPFDAEAVAVIAANNKKYINRLQDACPKKFFEDVFPVAVKFTTDEGAEKKGKKGKKEKKDKKDKKDKKGKGDKKGKKGKK